MKEIQEEAKAALGKVQKEINTQIGREEKQMTIK